MHIIQDLSMMGGWMDNPFADSSPFNPFLLDMEANIGFYCFGL
jgi:hypothetical protein